jgi:hypothetical protein
MGRLQDEGLCKGASGVGHTENKRARRGQMDRFLAGRINYVVVKDDLCRVGCGPAEAEIAIWQ